MQDMLEIAEKINKEGGQLYLVGGAVRDKILNKPTIDEDYCVTGLTVEKFMQLFPQAKIQGKSFPVFILNNKEIALARKERKIGQGHKDFEFNTSSNITIQEDLARRDFTMNTLCIDSNNNVIDLLRVRCDIDNHIIKTVGNPRYRIKEDSLRILRAIRFSTILDFKIDDRTMIYLKKYGYLLKNLSYNRKKEELDKIFSSSNREKGIKLILDLGLDKYLSIPKLKDVIVCDNIVGIWSQLDVDNLYPFTKLEKLQMKKVRELLELDLLDKYNVYKYGLYISTICADIKGIDKKEINVIRENFPILSKSDIKIHPIEIASILNIKPSSYLKEIMDNLEKDIIYGNVINEYEEIVSYIKEKYE